MVMTEQSLTRWSMLLVLVGLHLVACGPVAPAAAGDQPRPAAGRSGPDSTTYRALTAGSPTTHPGPQGTPTPAGTGQIDPWSLVAGGSAAPLAPPPALKIELAWSSDDAPISPYSPAALAVDRHGHLYVVDAGQHRIQVFDPDGQFLTVWGSQGGDAGQFRFLGPTRCADGDLDYCVPAVGGGVAVDAEGYVYVADYANHRIQKFDARGRFLTSWGSYGREAGQFDLPAGIAVNEQGHVYVSDSENHRIQQFDPTGRFLGQWGSIGAAVGQFFRPGALAVDGRGHVYVADPWHQRIQVFDRHGRFLDEWATGDRSDQVIQRPTGLALDPQGHLYSTSAFARVQKVDQAWRVVGTWGGGGRWNVALRCPTGIAVDTAGNVYIADLDSHRIVKFRQLLPTTR